MDITSRVIDAINGWLQSLAAHLLRPALAAAGQLLFQTPAYDSIPEVGRGRPPFAVRLWRMRQTESLVIRPHRSGYVFGGVFLLLTAVLWVIAQALNSIRSQNDMIIAWIVFPLLVLFGMSILLSTALPKVTVDGDIVMARDSLGRHRRFARSEVSHAAMRSIIAPSRYWWNPTNAFLLIGMDGRALLHLAQRDYDTPALERLVETLGLKWPETKSASVRQINREFPGAFAFDFQTIGIAILIIIAVALAVITLAIWFR